ncbi:MAG: AtpZ/AtpI family protein [Hyphomonadaceae bacterium]|nr:AtpZ/AtpI family protein [Hyphomonadaceae bacterium]
MAEENMPPEADPHRSLRRRLDAARGKRPGETPSQKEASAASLALRFGGEFGAAILVGSLIGFGVDHFLHTDPWGLVIGLGLGFAAGVTNVVRVASSYNRANPPDPRAKPILDEEDD